MIRKLLHQLEVFGSTQQGIYSNPERRTAWIEYLRLLHDDLYKVNKLIEGFQPSSKMLGIKLLNNLLKDIEEAYKIAHFASLMKQYPYQKSYIAEETLYFLFRSLYNKRKYPNPEDFKVEIGKIKKNGDFIFMECRPSFKEMREYIEQSNIENKNDFLQWLSVSYSILEKNNDD